jgi:tRNA-splicing ligase RtcB (3'-phosphate/5'-hydroxy nucleic acid ligase)
MPQKIGNVLSWGSEVEHDTIEQAAMASRLPFVKGHLALMPDAHIGMGATIGSVIPTQGAIIPSAIGVDIGCGMVAAETRLTADSLPDGFDHFLSNVERAVPAGLGKGHAFSNGTERDLRTSKVPPYSGATELSTQQLAKVTEQFGTLGSGNHFVEVCLDERNHVWVVLHSGSRGIGNQLATQHIDGAKGLMKKMFISLEDPDLAYLVEGSPEFDSYVADMLWAQEYARANREAMMDAVLSELSSFVTSARRVSDDAERLELRRINCHHNYTEREHHHGQNVWLTRKGAIRAREGDFGVIPGSMGTSSYIVRGLGNPASYESCSHGAGRRMSRGRARREIALEDFKTSMSGRDWQEDKADQLLDEAPQAYKDIDQVMADQSDLVAIEHTLHQILNYKGTT